MAASPHSTRQPTLRLSLHLRLELHALFAYILVLDTKRARELDERARRGREEERRWALEER